MMEKNVIMKFVIKYLILVFIFLFINTSFVFSKTVYISNVREITIRTGPDVKHKIITRIKSGSAIEMIKRNGDWARVKTSKGEKGWMLARFITDKAPDIFKFDKLKKKNKELSIILEKIKEENNKLIGIKEELEIIKKSYHNLKKESGDFLAIEKKHKKAQNKLLEQKKHIEFFENNSDDKKNIFFLSGAGVFIAGVFLGIIFRKKKKSFFF